MQEVETPTAVPEAPTSPEGAPEPPAPPAQGEPEVPAAPAEEAVVPTDEAEETPDAEETPLPYDEWKEQWNEDYKSSFEAELEQAKKDGHSEAQRRLQPKLDKIQQYAQQSQQHLQNISAELPKFLQWVNEREADGTFEPGEFWNEVSRRSPGMAAMAGIGALKNWQDAHAGMAYNLGAAAGIFPDDPSQAGTNPDYVRFVNSFAGAMDNADFKMAAQDFMDFLKDGIEKNAEERGYKRGLREGKQVATNAAKAQGRQGQGGDSAAGGIAGGRTWSSLTPQQRADIAAKGPQAVDAYIAQNG